MKRFLVTMMAVAFFGGLVSAAFAEAPAETVYETKKGSVTFNHAAHGEKFSCDKCHEGVPAKIEVDKAAAHGATCKGCHKAEGGPTKCNDCHKK